MEGLDLNLRHLRAFCEVAHCKKMSVASHLVHLSQPAITQAIAKLENLLNVILFDRRNDGMFTTESGDLFLSRAERALSYLEQGTTHALQAASRNAVRSSLVIDQHFTSAQLRALIAVSRARNFSIAAKQVGISQPSLHRAARDLERLIGIALFEKVSNGIQLTRSGEILVRHAKLSLAEMDQAFVEISEFKGEDVTKIVIGTLSLARTLVLPRAINKLAKLCPRVQISVVDGPYNELLHGLRHGEIDILVGALRNPVPIDDVEQKLLFVDQLAIIARKDHPLTKKNKITSKDLNSFPWVVPRIGTPTRDYFEKKIRPEEKSPSLVETSSFTLGRGLLLNSDRLSLMSSSQTHYDTENDLLTILAVDMTGSELSVGVTLRKGWKPTSNQNMFLDALQKASENISKLSA
jgi:LysR family transcriptional regulator, regulator for genes of the gallate degradation pathway